MKNIYIIPTDKPSRLYLWFDKLKLSKEFLEVKRNKQNIYITSDEEIKEGDWFTDNNNSLKTSYKLSHVQFANPKKIILTTDQELIKDGIEQISEDTLLKIVEHINYGKNIIKNNIVTITLWKWLETKKLIKQILNIYEKFIQNTR